MKMKKLVNILLFSSILLFVGCESEKKSATVKTVEMQDIQYLAPNGVDFVHVKNSDTYLMSLRESKEVGGFLQEVGSAKQKTKNMSILRSAKILRKSVDKVYDNLKKDNTIVSSISLLSSQSLQSPYGYTISHYQLRTHNDMQPMELSGELVGIMTNKALSDKPKAKKGAATSRNFRLVVIYGDIGGSTYYLASVVPEDIYGKHEGKINEIMNGARVSKKGTKLNSNTEKFEVKSNNNKVDFLFVVDDSGSMGDDQDALSRAALDFIQEMSTSSLSYRASIITTGNGIGSLGGNANRILREVGIIESDDELLRSRLVAGSNGSSTETGIFNAERALQSTASGDNTDGVVTTLGMPQQGSTMSVIILSDEPSQYRSRASRNFNPANNLFTKRNMKVYTIIDTEDNSHSQYDDLSMATNGMYADINNQDLNGTLNFTIIMKQIAQDAGGLASQISLAHSAAHIDKVEINGKSIKYSTTNGYTYVQASKAIVFHGIEFSKKSKNITIKVKYRYYQ